MDFSREGARPGPGPRSSHHPPPLTSPGSCQSQLRTGLCVLGRPRRGSRDRPGGAERSRRWRGDQHRTRERQVVPITPSSNFEGLNMAPFPPGLLWTSVAGPARGRRGLSHFVPVFKFPSSGVPGVGVWLAFAFPLFFACPELALCWPAMLGFLWWCHLDPTETVFFLESRVEMG